jgi:hypothetical protein
MLHIFTNSFYLAPLGSHFVPAHPDLYAVPTDACGCNGRILDTLQHFTPKTGLFVSRGAPDPRRSRPASVPPRSHPLRLRLHLRAKEDVLLARNEDTRFVTLDPHDLLVLVQLALVPDQLGAVESSVQSVSSISSTLIDMVVMRSR